MQGSKIIFGRWEAIALLLNLLATQIILGFPRSMLEVGGPAGWMIPVYVTIIALLCFAIISRLYKHFEGKDLLDISEYVGGNLLRIITGTIYFMYILIIVSVVLREFAEDMKVVALPVSPISFVELFFLAGILVGAYLGIEAIVRLNVLFIPVIAVGFLIITIGASKYFDLENIMPVFGTGPVQIFGRGFLKLSVFSAVSIIFFISPFIKTHKNFKAVGYTSIILAGILFIWGTLSYILVYAYPIGLERFLPVYQLARLISFGRFFQRIESIFVLIWAGAALLYLSSAFFFILHIFRKTFKLEYYKPLILPFAILIFSMSLFPPDVLTAVDLEQRYLRNYLWITAFVIPIILLLAANGVRKRRSGNA